MDEILKLHELGVKKYKGLWLNANQKAIKIMTYSGISPETNPRLGIEIAFAILEGIRGINGGYIDHALAREDNVPIDVQ